jgi:mRNA-degrading endonuclease RelE of RelBE toxin-antitoxin system
VFEVSIKKKVLKTIHKLPIKIQKNLATLVEDLAYSGPIQRQWPNFSELGKGEYHCHLDYSWVACWKHEKNTLVIEVYYAGSRENAPY